MLDRVSVKHKNIVWIRKHLVHTLNYVVDDHGELPRCILLHSKICAGVQNAAMRVVPIAASCTKPQVSFKGWTWRILSNSDGTVVASGFGLFQTGT